HIEPPQLLERLVVERHDRAVEHAGENEAAGGGQGAGGIRKRKLGALLDLAGDRIEPSDRAGDRSVCAGIATEELALDVGAGVDRDLAAALERRDVKRAGIAAIGRRPEIGAAADART